MSCTSPRCAFVSSKGGRPYFCSVDFPSGPFVHPVYGSGRIVYVPCGHCLDCLVARRQDVTMLQCLEASLHDDNWFLTLTYDDARLGYVPTTLDKSHVNVFIESVRHVLKYRGIPFRFYGCGEYGDERGRPHYHISVFGVPASALGLVDDRVDNERFGLRAKSLLVDGRFRSSAAPLVDSNGRPYWQSDLIGKYWRYGAHKVYRANRATFQYVAGYVTKKLYGVDRRRMVKMGIQPPYSFQSRPSIGYPWFVRYCDSISQVNERTGKLVNDFISVDGVTWRCPRIFDKWMQANDRFGGLERSDSIKFYRSRDGPSVPDRIDLLRKSYFARYRAEHFKHENRHKEL